MKEIEEATSLMLDHILDEVMGARAKFPRNKHQLAAKSEEDGELAKAMIEREIGLATSADVYKEAVQCAAMAIRVAIDGDSDFEHDLTWADMHAFTPTGAPK